MPVPAGVHDKLKDALKGITLTIDGEEIEAYEAILGENGWLLKSEAASKIQQANKEISDERMLSDDDKKRFDEFKANGGRTQDVEAEINKYKDDLSTLTEKVQNLTKSVESERAAALAAKRNELNMALDSDILGSLQEANIVGKNAKIALNLIKSEGLAKYSDPDDQGNVSRAFAVVKDGKMLKAESLADVANHVATEYENLVSSSNQRGSGMDHGGNGGGNQVDYNNMNTQQMRDSFAISE